MADLVTTLTRVATAALPDAPNLQREIDERMARIPTRLNAYGYDAWGFHPDSARRHKPTPRPNGPCDRREQHITQVASAQAYRSRRSWGRA